MSMQLTGNYHFEAGRDQVWTALNDPAVLQAATPGCESLRQIGEDAWEADLKIGLAGIKGSYKGQIRLSEKEAPERFTLEIGAKGPTGIVEAKVRLTLTEATTGTALAYEGEARVSGPVAGIGQRLLSGAAKLILGQFWGGIEKHLREVAGR
jgi:carbon monoxide dehydrogenase subunit G